VPSTVVDLLDLSNESNIPGHTLRRYWDSSLEQESASKPLVAEVPYAPNSPSWYPVSKGGMRSLIAGRYHVIINGDGQLEIYDILNDPFEKRDIAGAPEGLRVIEQLDLPENVASSGSSK
jgi:hypothetical protein